MKAWIVRELGEPAAVLMPADIDEPAAGGDRAIVAVEAVGLNYLDVMMCRGQYPRQLAPPIVPGCEVVGRVIDPGGSGFRAGDRIAAINPSGSGCLAERVALPSYTLLPLPDAIPAADGAAMLIAYQTAYFALHHRAGLVPEERLLVTAGAGGVGIAAIQLGKAAGARVIAAARGEEKLAICREEGADFALDYRDDDFAARVLDFTDGAGIDIVCEHVGGEAFERALHCLAFEGRILPIGWAGGIAPHVQINELVARNLTLIGLSWGSTYPRIRPALVDAAHSEILALYRRGRVRPRISSVVSFDAAAMALQELGAGKTIGKIIVAVSEMDVAPDATNFSQRPLDVRSAHDQSTV